MKCTNCGAELEQGTMFCGSCGTPVQAPVQPQYQQAPVQPQRPLPKKQYIERLPNGYINKKQELLADFAAEAAALLPPGGGPTNMSVETTSEDIPVQGGSGNGSLQRALNAEGA